MHQFVAADRWIISACRMMLCRLNEWNNKQYCTLTQAKYSKSKPLTGAVCTPLQYDVRFMCSRYLLLMCFKLDFGVDVQRTVRSQLLLSFDKALILDCIFDSCLYKRSWTLLHLLSSLKKSPLSKCFWYNAAHTWVMMDEDQSNNLILVLVSYFCMNMAENLKAWGFRH